MLHVGLNLGIVEFSANKTLSIKDGVGWVHGDLVLSCVTDQTLGVGEGDEGRSCAVALVVGNDFDSVISKDTHAGVRGTEIDTYGRTISMRLW